MKKSKISSGLKMRASTERSDLRQLQSDMEVREREDYWEALHRFKKVLERQSFLDDDEKRCFEQPVSHPAQHRQSIAQYSIHRTRHTAPSRHSHGDESCSPTRTQRDYGYEN